MTACGPGHDGTARPPTPGPRCPMPARVAVILSGCGVHDGSEIHEAVLTLLALDRAGAHVRCFAPDKEQAKVVNHVTKKPANEKRNDLVESARIAGGAVAALATAAPAE